jgi:hypothetical protein
MQWYGVGRPRRHAGRRRQALNETLRWRCSRRPTWREAGRRGGRALPMTPEQFGDYIKRRHRALDRSRAKHPDRTRPPEPSRPFSLFSIPFPLTNEPLMARNTQVPPTTTPRPSPASWPSTSPTTLARLERRGRPRGAPHLLNWLGCAVGAAKHEAADAALAAVQVLQPAPQATVLGRSEKVDIASAALVNGITSHTFDFDDTHLKTIIHPAGPVASAVLALAEHTGASGRDVVDALVLGIDVACRLGNTVYPEHYDRGWHITGTTGMLGAAAGCARLLKLDAQTDADGAGHRRLAAGRPARAVRHHDQALPPRRRGARRPDVGAAGAARASPPARARSKRRAAGRRWCRPSTPGTRRPTNSASASRSRSTATSPSPAAS